MTAWSARGKRWKLRELPPPDFAALLGCSDVIAALLYQRNLQTPEAVQHFFEDTYKNGLHDPLLLKGMPEACDRIMQAIANQEPMSVYGDFDTDGVTAVALLMQAIPALGGIIEPYIPHREREGYGLNAQAIEHLVQAGTRLLITVDCGISNVTEVERANELGLDVIITDHHQPPPQLPPALAIINPKQSGCAYPYKQLVGVGIAFKLVQALIKRGLRFNLRGRDMLDVVALGTVADMAPLQGENRVLVKAGLEALRQTERPGLRALIKSARLTQQHIDSTAIGFMLGPRINAAGRLDDAVHAYNLLLAQDLATAERLSQELERVNQERQKITRRVVEEAAAQAEETGKSAQRIVILDSEDYPAGVVGLVAARLVERWARPVILIARGEEVSRASARSIPNFNIFAALTTCRELFLRFGGHSMAAGFTIATQLLPDLEARLQHLADQQLGEEALEPTLYIDAEVALHDLTWEFFQRLTDLEPFGQGNQCPVFLSSRVCVQGLRPVGGAGKHLKLFLGEQAHTQATGTRPLEAIAFNLGDQEENLRKHPWIDVVYTLEVNSWQGKHTLQLNVKDLRYV